MRISDWSSDVCSSDLEHPARTVSAHVKLRRDWLVHFRRQTQAIQKCINSDPKNAEDGLRIILRLRRATETAIETIVTTDLIFSGARSETSRVERGRFRTGTPQGWSEK